MPITSFSGKYDFLSNMFVCLIVDTDGMEYRSSEHYYQSHKTLNVRERYLIQTAKTPMNSRTLGRKCELRSNWNDVKDQVMETALRLKFNNEYLRNKLIETYPHDLVEGNYWGDTYWGVCNDKGTNKLGLLLMKIRNEFVSLQDELRNIKLIKVTADNVDEIFGIIEDLNREKRYEVVEKTMNKINYNKYIEEGEDRETAICKSIHDELGLPYPEEPDCDECPSQNECITAFIGTN